MKELKIFLKKNWPWWVVPLGLCLCLIVIFMVMGKTQDNPPFVYTSF